MLQNTHTQFTVKNDLKSLPPNNRQVELPNRQLAVLASHNTYLQMHTNTHTQTDGRQKRRQTKRLKLKEEVRQQKQQKPML